jgi:hypothetical protein
MTPTFALDLALDGIRLLYRADGGWTVMGDVALEDPALSARLAALRTEAEALAPGAVATELVIPPCQIRYATLPAPDMAPDDASVHAAALDLTPLDPEDLVVDWELEGDRLRLALVDRVTLMEAEDFAEAHGYNPVAFSARPSSDQFPRAPWFGATSRALSRTRAAVAPPAAPPRLRPEAAQLAIAPEALAASLSPPTPEPEAPPARIEAKDPPLAASLPAPPLAAPTPSRAEVTVAAGVPEARAAGLSAPAPGAEETPTHPRAESAPLAVGAEALAASLSAPRPDATPRQATRPPLVPAGSRAPRRLMVLGGAAAALLLGVAVASLGLRGLAPVSDPAALLSDTPPQVALGAPDLAPPETAQTASLSPAGTAPPEVPDAPAVLPDLAEATAPADLPAADTASPEALADANPAEAEVDILLLAAAPALPALTEMEGTEAIYFASIDPVTRGSDAVMLPSAASMAATVRPVTPLAPPPPGTTFDLGEDGLVRATPEGALTPDGIVVTDGRPPLLPPPAPARTAEDATPAPFQTALALPARPPAPRPAGLVERGERAALGGFSRSELAGMRPAPRPASAQAVAEAELPAGAPPTAQAVAVSVVPPDRPLNLASRAATAAAIAAALAAPEPAAPARTQEPRPGWPPHPPQRRPPRRRTTMTTANPKWPAPPPPSPPPPRLRGRRRSGTRSACGTST